MERIKSCRICGSPNLKEILDLGEQPLANSLVKSPDEREAFYPLSISRCGECSLIQLNHTAEPGDLFSDYVWVTSTSKVAKDHADKLCQDVMGRVENLKQSYILEAASNDGTFLKPFAERGYAVLGVDPAKNIAEMANRDGIPTLPQFFGVKTAEAVVREKGLAKVVIARNVLPHVANLHDFVKGMRLCLAPDGLLVIEFHYAGVIYEGLHYDSIYHEHLCYYTLRSMENLLNRYGLYIKDISESPISGGSLILYAGVGEGKEKSVVQEYRDTEKRNAINELKSWESFAKRVYDHRNRLVGILEKAVKKGGPVTGYGASARSSTLLNFCKIDTKYVSLIADQNRLKQGLFTAGTHIPIASPDDTFKDNSKCVFIMAWNFAEEIMGILKEKYGFKGQCILPLPNNPRIINIA